MKRILIDVYLVLYKLTKSSIFAYLFAVCFVTALNLITIYGLTLLLQGLYPMLGYLKKMFVFPIYFVPTLLLFWYNYKLIPLNVLSKKKKEDIFYLPLLIYTSISVVLFLYIFYKDRLPQ